MFVALSYICINNNNEVHFLNLAAMTTIKVTLPSNKAGQLRVFTIEFSIKDFDKVIDAVSEVKTIDDLKKSELWKVI